MSLIEDKKILSIFTLKYKVLFFNLLSETKAGEGLSFYIKTLNRKVLY